MVAFIIVLIYVDLKKYYITIIQILEETCLIVMSIMKIK